MSKQLLQTGRIKLYSQVIPAIFAIGLTLSSCALFSSKPQPTAPVFTNPTAIINQYLPLSSLQRDILEGTEGDKHVRIERSRKAGTKTFTVHGQSVQALIVEDREFFNEELEEVTLDYFAQADDGTVYYLGEDVDIYQNGQVTSHEGAWLYGVHTDKLGIFFPANPKVGDKFRSEDVPAITQEDDEVVSVSESVTVPAGTFGNCVKIKEILSDGEIEYKYFAPGVGIIKEVPQDGEVNLKSHN